MAVINGNITMDRIMPARARHKVNISMAMVGVGGRLGEFKSEMGLWKSQSERWMEETVKTDTTVLGTGTDPPPICI